MRASFTSLLFAVGVVCAAQVEVVPSTPVVDSAAVRDPLIIGGSELIEATAANTAPKDSSDWRQRHSPGRATLFSAVLPGAGQLYNRKYWKAPLVWGALGTSLYFVQRNGKEFRRYKDAYIAVTDGDPSTSDEFNGRVSAQQLLDVTDTYRKWRDMSYIAVGLIYVLNIVDASVDANFVRFDVSRDLTLNASPSWELASRGALGLSLSLSVR
ncbi:MAG TPA: DUF5683 domain-containing protein [Flavobacteriales bacterium]|nr:DUF5683 domain-containing protein [Flavobacteriales bacterium]